MILRGTNQSVGTLSRTGLGRNWGPIKRKRDGAGESAQQARTLSKYTCAIMDVRSDEVIAKAGRTAKQRYLQESEILAWIIRGALRDER